MSANPLPAVAEPRPSAKRRNIDVERSESDVEMGEALDEDRTLASYLDAEDYVDNISEEDKRVFKDVTIRLVKNNSYFRDGVQPYLKFNLDRFLETEGEKEADSPIVGMRLAAQDFGFDQDLAHERDVEAFKDELKRVQKWHTDDNTRNKFLAPLLPVIQSSGTGKSRLLHSVRERNPNFYRSILLTDQADPGVKGGSYDCVYKVNNEEDKKEMKTKLRNLVLSQCEKAVESAAEKSTESVVHHITLFFDEAQHLTTNDGYLFRVLRWIIREKYIPGTGGNYKYRITVVVAGTNSKLANFFPEKDVRTSGLSSRYVDGDNTYHEEDKELFQPFFTLRTQGCLSQKLDGSDGQTEYQKMIRFSRPLFALLHKKNMLDKHTEFDIAWKIVLGRNWDWINDQRACLSVLATRVQMGSTSSSVVSDLVSKGYAHLTFFQNNSSIDSDVPSHASFAFLPDPVCARMAMCLMDEDFKISRSERSGEKNSAKSGNIVIQGQQKQKLVEAMGRIFSGGMCLPAKGDFGEVAVALYLLFCGDIIRKEYNKEEIERHYHRLSVGFSGWMNILWKGGRSTKLPPKKEDLQVNCIQFFRFSFRKSMKELADSFFLESLYQKGCAIYCSANTEAIDLVIPCCCTQNNEYIPIFVSVKNYGQLNPHEANEFLGTSLKALNDAGIKKGLLLLGVAGQDRQNEQDICRTYEKYWEETKGAMSLVTENTLTSTQSIQETLRVGFFCVHNDSFGINDMLKDSSLFVEKKQTADLYCMHSELIHGSSTLNDPSASFRKDAKTFFDDTFKCIKDKE